MIKDPSEKDKIYLANVEKIGKSIENIQYIENVLSQEEHETLFGYVKNIDSWNIEPWGSRTITTSKMTKEVTDILEKIFNFVYKKSKELYRVEIDNFKNGQFSIVKFPQGFALEPHVDTLSDESLHIASIYYINDDYEGGDINFPDYNLTISQKSNSLIIFPGNENYLHQVFEVLSGDRYTSPMWFRFTGSEFYKKREWYD
jgi:hypothetical protein